MKGKFMAKFCNWLALMTAIVLGVMASEIRADVGDTLSITITNKTGDVLSNLIVSRVFSDGLLLRHPKGLLKMRFEDLPKEIRDEYQPLAAKAKNEAEQAQIAADYIARQQQQAPSQASPVPPAPAEQPVTQSETNEVAKELVIDVPGQGWKITVLDPEFKTADRIEKPSQFIYRTQTADGFTLAIFVEKAIGPGASNDDVYNAYWLRASRNTSIDQKSVKMEKKDKFVKVSYRTGDGMNAHYYFAFKGKWVDVHVSKPSATETDQKLFADFEKHLSYSE